MGSADRGARLPSLERIAARADAKAYDLDAVDWTRGLDPERWYFPEHLTPLAHTPSYADLSPTERLDYNHLYAEAINEQFVFLEEYFLVRVLRRLLRGDARVALPADLRACLEGFVAEEVKHTEMFRRLAQLMHPRYAERDFFFLRLGRAERVLLSAMERRPDLLAFWCWLALAFEEKTVDYFRHFARHEQQRPDLPLDPLCYEVHRLHMLDEVRHVQLDHHLIHHVYAACGPLLRGLNVRLITRTLAAYTRPKRTNLRIVEALAARHPRLDARRLSREVRALAQCATWQEVSYSRSNVPQTFALFDAYPELHGLARVLLCYEPPRGAA